jgi:hypothetical protein
MEEEEVGDGRNRRRSMKSGAKNRRPCAQLGASRDDSAHQEVEDDEAHPPVPSERRGMMCNGGAMTMSVVAVGFSPWCSWKGFPFVEKGKGEGAWLA